MYYRSPVFPEEEDLLRNMCVAAQKEAREEISCGSHSNAYTLFGFNGKVEPSALLQMDDNGRINVLYVEPEDRWQGLGVQLIGQAVQRALALEKHTLQIRLRRENDAWKLFAENGFIPVEEITEGPAILEKELNCDDDFEKKIRGSF